MVADIQYVTGYPTHIIYHIVHSSTKSVEGAAGTLKGINDIERSNCLALGVLCVCHGVADDLNVLSPPSANHSKDNKILDTYILEEDLENTTGLFVDET